MNNGTNGGFGIGYACVSTLDQGVALQHDALAGAPYD